MQLTRRSWVAVALFGAGLCGAASACGSSGGEDDVALPERVVYRADPQTPPARPALLLGAQPLVLFYDQNAGAVQAAYFAGTTWNTELVDGSGEADRGAGLAAARDSTGTVHAAYRDASVQNVRYVSGVPGDWQAETPLPEGQDRGRAIDIAVDLNDDPWIAFRNETTQALEVVRRSQQTWFRETVDSEGNTGLFPAIAVGAGGEMHVAYRNGSDGTLRYALQTAPGQWQREIAAGDVDATWLSLLVRPPGSAEPLLNMPRVLFLDEILNEPRFALRGNDANWQLSRVDPETFGGSDNCLALRQDGTVYAAFLDQLNLDLKIAKLTDGRWRVWTEDSTGATGFQVSCAVGDDGRLRVAYVRRDTGELLFRMVEDRF